MLVYNIIRLLRIVL